MSHLFEMSLSQLARGLQDKEYSVTEAVESCLGRIESTEPKINALVSVFADQAKKQAAQMDAAGPQAGQPLWGVPVTLKDLICSKGDKTTCSSRFLENFTPYYDATVTSCLKDAGAVILGKNNMDEFAMGSTTESSCFGRTANPWDLGRIPGGSSGGSAASVAAGQCFASLGTDSGGSIRQPAGLCGCVGLKPTYGQVSRYGAVAFGSSFDQIGPLARSVEDCARVFEVIAGPDNKDATSARLDLYPENLPGQDFVAQAVRGVTQDPAELVKGLRIGIPEEYWASGLSGEVDAACRKALQELEAQGAQLVPVSLPHQKYAIAVYYIMASAEASTNLARFDGVRYGRRADNPEDLIDLYVKSRSQGFGEEVQRRILLGTFVLSAGFYDAYYRKAAQVRRLLRDDFDKALGQCDVIAAPTSIRTAWEFGSFGDDPLAAYKMDLLTVTLNLVGLPGLALPVGLGAESGLPVGLQLMGKAFDEAALLRLGAVVERLSPKLGTPKGLI